MDTTVMEYTAENLIAHKLQRAGVLVAKPNFDRNGTDLLAFVGVSDGEKFCRIQSKGRSLRGSRKSHVSVPEAYVSDAFILFLYVETNDKDKTHLFCFFGRDIQAHWSLSRDGKRYTLSISEEKLNSDLREFEFNDPRVHEIKKTILNVDRQGEFKKVLYGYMELTLDDIQ